MWLKEHKSIIIGICIVLALLVLGGMAVKGSDGVKGTIQSAAASITKPLSKVSDGIGKGLKGIFRFKEVTAENEALKEQAQQLKQENAKLELSRRERQELEELSKVFQYESLAYKDFLALNVVSMDFSTWQGIFTVDKGSESGIKKGMAIVAGDGLVGKVAETSKGTAKIASILSDSSKISFQVARDSSLTGVIQGDGKKGLTGYLLDGEAHVKKGDVLITSGIGSYPEGLKIGTVVQVEKNKGTQKVAIKAEPVVSFTNLKKVAAVL